MFLLPNRGTRNEGRNWQPTAWKAVDGGYRTDKRMAVFGGVAPTSSPSLATVVVIDEPSSGLCYGGDVAAPVFSDVISEAMRTMNVPPDNLGTVPIQSIVDGPHEPD